MTARSILVGFLVLAGLASNITAEGSGLEEATLSHGEVVRTYHVYTPSSHKGNDPIPLVIVFHGGLGNGLKIAKQTGFNAVAESAGFAAVYPDSLKYWNDGRDTTAAGVDDVAFVRVLIDHLVKGRNIDRQRVYATGASNGGMFTLRLACDMSDQVAAFAPVIASMPVAYTSRCKPKRPVAMMMINGTADGFIPWQGGVVRSGWMRGAGGNVISVPDTVAFWVKHNTCSAHASVESLPDVDKNDGATVEVWHYRGCQDGVVLKLVKIEGGGHTWPGSPVRIGPLLGRIVGNTSRDVNASEMIWNFFQGHRLR
ncbi:MAG: alpha/beta hydrolase family esterase [Candidatus Methylomirabilales bacterium]